MAEHLQENPDSEPLDPLYEYAALYDEFRDRMQEGCAPDGPAEILLYPGTSMAILAGHVHFEDDTSRVLVLVDVTSAPEGNRRLITLRSPGFDDDPDAIMAALNANGYQDPNSAMRKQEDAEVYETLRVVLGLAVFDAELTKQVRNQFANAAGRQ